MYWTDPFRQYGDCLPAPCMYPAASPSIFFPGKTSCPPKTRLEDSITRIWIEFHRKLLEFLFRLRNIWPPIGDIWVYKDIQIKINKIWMTRWTLKSWMKVQCSQRSALICEFRNETDGPLAKITPVDQTTPLFLKVHCQSKIAHRQVSIGQYAEFRSVKKIGSFRNEGRSYWSRQELRINFTCL